MKVRNMGSKVGLASSICAVLIMVGFLVTLVVFYGIFAFGSYEDWNCYASKESSN